MFHSSRQYLQALLQRNSRLLKLIIPVSILLFAAIFVFKNQANTPATTLKKIAITQIVAHPSLDKVRQGIMEELSANGYQDGKTATILFENAQGNVAIAAQIAQSFVAQHPDVMVAIATPSAQSLVNVTQKSKIPVVFASITDPLKAKLVTDLKHPNDNVTGTRNVTPVDKQLELIKKILPQLKTLGIVVNYGEENSVDLLKTITDEAKKFNITVKAVGVASSADVQSATATLVGQADALLLLQDNTVAEALPALMSITQKNNLPVFTTYLDAVKMGALAGLACDEYKLGRQTGKMVVKILQGEKPGDIAVEDPSDISLAINLTEAKQLHITISPELIKQAGSVM
ncbi:MAG: ABC transporter substrate-binding protein [Gammaproteobacteria bacterium]